jgi:hypothetical protein
MANFLFAILLAVVLAIAGAAQFQHQGYFLAEQICLATQGACSYPVALAVVAACLFIGLAITRPK